ncbi:hypothetical protein EU545_04710 [Candidatus Thorarchaeota archaeon]|nr:MAG: hypothetical protein EU545_04710 [Candidatus Thorarchaeota archaeon]
MVGMYGNNIRSPHSGACQRKMRLRENELEYTRDDGSTARKAIRGNEVYLGMMEARSVDLSSIHDPRYIRILWLYDNWLERIDLTPLTDFTRLESLSLRGNHLTEIDLRPLAACDRLRRLDLSGNRLTTIDLSPLKSCSYLERVNLGGNSFRELDLGVMGMLPRLRELVLGLDPHTKVSDTKSVSVHRGEEPKEYPGEQENLRLDLTPLFWSTSLESVVIGPTDIPYAESLLRHIALSRTKNNRDLITSAPEPIPVPAMLWLDDGFAEDIHWIQYTASTTRPAASLLEDLKRSVGRIDTEYWFHAQKGMMDGLGLSWISGYDGPPMDLLTLEESPEDIHILKQEVSRQAARLLRKQVRAGGSTLFISIDDTIAHGFVDLASEVVTARKHEFEEMQVPVNEGYASIGCLLLSDYGLRLCREVGIRQARIKEELFETIRRALAAAGLFVERVDVSSRRDFHEDMPNVSESLSDFVLRYYIRTA